MKNRTPIVNDTPVYHAFDDCGNWIGMGTTQAIKKRRLRSDGIVHWCPHEYLVDGWRNK